MPLLLSYSTLLVRDVLLSQASLFHVKIYKRPKPDWHQWHMVQAFIKDYKVNKMNLSPNVNSIYRANARPPVSQTDQAWDLRPPPGQCFRAPMRPHMWEYAQRKDLGYVSGIGAYPYVVPRSFYKPKRGLILFFFLLLVSIYFRLSTIIVESL